MAKQPEMLLRTWVDYSGDLHMRFEDTVSGFVQESIAEMVMLKEKAVRDWLISNGWTPPKDGG